MEGLNLWRAMAHAISTARSRPPALVNVWLVQADRAGCADEELAALIKVLRARPPAGVKAA